MSSKSHPDDQPYQLPSHIGLWSLCGGLLCVLYGLSRSPAWVESEFINGFGVFGARSVAFVSAQVPISLAEVMIIGLVVWGSLSLSMGLSPVARGRRRLINAMVCGAAQLLDIVMVILLLFYGLWGTTYARAPAHERLGLELHEVGEGDDAVADLAALAEAVQDRAASHYRALHQSDDGGRLTDPGPLEVVDRAVDQGFVASGAALGLPESYRASRGQHKAMMASDVMGLLGLGGFYFPLTGEANVNTGSPPWGLAFTFAHEKAHQRMVGSEDEANFFGFLACVYSDDPAVRYAGWMHAERRLVSTVSAADYEAGAALKARRLPGIQRDLDAVYAYWARFEGPGQLLSRAVNDAYLKANQVQGGVLAYRRVGLLAAWADTPAGREKLAR